MSEEKKTKESIEEKEAVVETVEEVVEAPIVKDENKPRVSTGSLSKGRYIETVGRRKTAIARVRISESGRSMMTINGKSLTDYFPIEALQKTVNETLAKANITQKFSISAKVSGGGITSQAEAVRLGISRALIVYDMELRDNLKKAGFLKRDPRIKERKKPGLKKARKRPQWSKR
jgi:small subunit ribosomal protein S9